MKAKKLFPDVSFKRLWDRVNKVDKIDELQGSLINENNESFNFGIKDGVRGFFTDPSRADDSFVPFKGKPKEVVYNSFSADKNVYHSYTVEEDGCYLLVSGNTSTGGTTSLYSFAGADVNNPDTSVLEENISRWDINDQSHINVYYYECKAGDILTTYSYDNGGGYRFSWVTIMKL